MSARSLQGFNGARSIRRSLRLRPPVTRHRSLDGRGRVTARSQYRRQYRTASGPSSMASRSRAACPPWSTWLFLASSFTDPRAQDRVGSTSQPPTARRPPPAVTVTRAHRQRKRISTRSDRDVGRASLVLRAVGRPSRRRRRWQKTVVATQVGYVQQPPSTMPQKQKRSPKGNNIPSRQRMPVCQHG